MFSAYSLRKDARTLPPASKKAARRRRDYLLPEEVDRLMEAALQTGRHGHRNYTLILICFRHGLRLGELTALEWKAVDFQRKLLKVTRLSNGVNSTQPLATIELRALRKLKKEYPRSRYVFVSTKGRKLSTRSVSRIVSEAGEIARLRFHVSLRMLRHGCGHALASAGHNMVALQHYMGHRNIRHTLRYFELPPNPFKNFWKK
jgi:type 1 fimbriae regulatory protein FimB/type 1 fimbriae regulatory protein FimE